jgi:hypothetical protein
VTNAPNSTDARDAEIAQLEAKGHVVLDIYNPRNHLCEPLASKVALLKAVFGIDDSGRLTRPPPPKAFSQQVFEYIMGGRIRERRQPMPAVSRKPPRPTLARALKQATKAGKSVKGAEVYQDRVVLQFGEPERVETEDPWPLDEFRTKETKQ